MQICYRSLRVTRRYQIMAKRRRRNGWRIRLYVEWRSESESCVSQSCLPSECSFNAGLHIRIHANTNFHYFFLGREYLLTGRYIVGSRSRSRFSHLPGMCPESTGRQDANYSYPSYRIILFVRLDDTDERRLYRETRLEKVGESR